MISCLDVVSFGLGFLWFDLDPQVCVLLGPSFVFTCSSVFFDSRQASSGVGWVAAIFSVVCAAVDASEVVWAVSVRCCVHGVAVFPG